LVATPSLSGEEEEIAELVENWALWPFLVGSDDDMILPH